MTAQQSFNLGKILHNIGAWFKKTFTHIKDDIAPIAIHITQAIKESVQSGFIPDLAHVIDEITGKQIASDVVAFVKANINKVLALELGLTALPDDATDEQIQEFLDDAIVAFGGVLDKSKIWTSVVITAFNSLKEKLGTDNKLTWAETATFLDDLYKAIEAAKQVAKDANENEG